jgi:hypothetical protein
MQARSLALSWLFLVVLSVLTVSLAGYKAILAFQLAVVVAACLKAWCIIDGFMELRQVAGFWRWLMLGWPLLMGAALSLGLLLA